MWFNGENWASGEGVWVGPYSIFNEYIKVLMVKEKLILPKTHFTERKKINCDLMVEIELVERGDGSNSKYTN